MTNFEGWQKWLKRANKADNTISGYVSDLTPILIFAFGDLEDKSQEEYEKFNSNSLYEFVEQNNFSPATIGRKIAAIKCFYKYLINECGIVKTNPFEKVSRPSIPKPKSKALTEEQTLEVFDKIEQARETADNGIRDYAIMQIMMNAPVRKSEIQNLKRSEYVNGILCLNSTKGQKNREIACITPMKIAIDAYLETRNDNEEWLFLSERGNRMSTKAMDNVVHKYAGTNPHALRATAATNMYNNDIPVPTIKELGGWDLNSNTFETHYLKIRNESKMSAMEETYSKMQEKRRNK